MELTYLKNGESLAIDEAKCVGCGACVDVCPHAVISLEGPEKKAAIAARSRCMECGACAINCPVSAIAVNRGVGCAAAIIGGILRGGPATCDCGSVAKKGCC